MRASLALAVRGLARRPLFVIAAVTSLALATGVLIAIASLSYTLFVAPLPFPAPDRLVVMHEVDPDGQPTGVALRNLRDFREPSDSFASMAAFIPRTFGLRTTDDRAVVTRVGQVTAPFFDTLGLAPIAGRVFTEEEELADAPVIVLSYELWDNRFGADPDLIGNTVLLNEQPRTVVGIMPESLRFPMGPALDRHPLAYIPIRHDWYDDKRAVRTLGAIARLEPTATLALARAELTTMARRLADEYPDTNRGYGATIEPLRHALGATNVRPMRYLAGAGMALFLIATVNLLGLAIARLASQGREIGIHIAMGADRSKLFSVYLAEAGCIGTLGVAGGIALASIISSLVIAWLPTMGGTSGLEPPPTHWIAILVGAGATITVVALLAALPGWLSYRSSLATLLFAGSFTRVPVARMRFGLVAGQMAIALMLVLTTSILGASFQRLSAVDPGFTTENTLSFGIGLPEARYESKHAFVSFHHRLLDEIRSIPGVSAAGAGSGPLLAGPPRMRIRFRREGDENAPIIDWTNASARLASPGYFQATGIPLRRGRSFAWTDDLDHPRVILVNHAFERSFFPADGALGKRLALSWRTPDHPESSLFEIVGVIGDARQFSLRDDAVPEIVMAFTQFPGEADGARYSIRARSGGPAIPSAIRERIDELDATLEAVQIRPASARVEESLSQERTSLLLAAIAGVTALVLAGIGIYGVLMFFVVRQQREIGIRAALGAGARELLVMVATECGRMAALGCAAGALGFWLFIAPAMRSQLYDVSVADPILTTASLLILAVVAIAAAIGPVRAATRVSPMEVLRDE